MAVVLVIAGPAKLNETPPAALAAVAVSVRTAQVSTPLPVAVSETPGAAVLLVMVVLVKLRHPLAGLVAVTE